MWIWIASSSAFFEEDLQREDIVFPFFWLDPWLALFDVL